VRLRLRMLFKVSVQVSVPGFFLVPLPEVDEIRSKNSTAKSKAQRGGVSWRPPFLQKDVWLINIFSVNSGVTGVAL
jgi:hypothetical protein